MKVLLTGFEPFGGEISNPSATAVQQLLGSPPPEGIDWQGLILPVEFQRSAQLLLQKIDQWQPALVICVGQAGGRPQLSLEQVAINLLEARIPDNSGWQPAGEPVVAGAPAAYFSNLPLKAMRQAVQEQGIPAQISYTAGTYVCNALMYQLMHHLSQRPACRGGFVHIPYTPAQTLDKPTQPAMATELVTEALRAIVLCCQQHHEDIQAVAGNLD